MKRLFRTFGVMLLSSSVLFGSSSSCTWPNGDSLFKTLISVRMQFFWSIFGSQTPSGVRRQGNDVVAEVEEEVRKRTIGIPLLTAWISPSTMPLFSVFEMVSVWSFSFIHFLCKSAKYLIRWAWRYGSCLWGNLNAQQWKECVSHATRKFLNGNGRKVNINSLPWVAGLVCVCVCNFIVFASNVFHKMIRLRLWRKFNLCLIARARYQERCRSQEKTHLERVHRWYRFQRMSVLYSQHFQSLEPVRWQCFDGSAR